MREGEGEGETCFRTIWKFIFFISIILLYFPWIFVLLLSFFYPPIYRHSLTLIVQYLRVPNIIVPWKKISQPPLRPLKKRNVQNMHRLMHSLFELISKMVRIYKFNSIHSAPYTHTYYNHWLSEMIYTLGAFVLLCFAFATVS